MLGALVCVMPGVLNLDACCISHGLAHVHVCFCARVRLQEQATAKAEAVAASGDLPPALDEDTDKYVLPAADLNSDSHLIRRVCHTLPFHLPVDPL